jgi:hypothetical protein
MVKQKPHLDRQGIDRWHLTAPKGAYGGTSDGESAEPEKTVSFVKICEVGVGPHEDASLVPRLGEPLLIQTPGLRTNKTLRVSHSSSTSVSPHHCYVARHLPASTHFIGTLLPPRIESPPSGIIALMRAVQTTFTSQVRSLPGTPLSASAPLRHCIAYSCCEALPYQQRVHGPP